MTWNACLQLACLALTVALADIACAQGTQTTTPPANRVQETPAANPKPSSAELLDALRERGKSRGLQPRTPAETAEAERKAQLIAALKKKATRGLSVEERAELSSVVADRPAVNIEIYFDLDSARVSPRAEPSLDALGTALADAQLAGRTIMIAGHTDAQGPASYNQALSERRARAVKEYLVRKFKLSDDALMAVGYGKERLKLKDQPFAGENRRVEVVNLGS